MGYIRINSVTFSPTPSSNVDITIEYKLSLDPPDDYVAATTGLSVPPSGILDTPYDITGLTENRAYSVRISSECGSEEFEVVATVGSPQEFTLLVSNYIEDSEINTILLSAKVNGNEYVFTPPIEPQETDSKTLYLPGTIETVDLIVSGQEEDTNKLVAVSLNGLLEDTDSHSGIKENYHFEFPFPLFPGESQFLEIEYYEYYPEPTTTSTTTTSTSSTTTTTSTSTTSSTTSSTTTTSTSTTSTTTLEPFLVIEGENVSDSGVSRLFNFRINATGSITTWSEEIENGQQDEYIYPGTTGDPFPTTITSFRVASNGGDTGLNRTFELYYNSSLIGTITQTSQVYTFDLSGDPISPSSGDIFTVIYWQHDE